MPQWLARLDHRFAQLHLERMFLGRHKFYHFRIWYRDKLSAYLKEMLLNSQARARPYICGHSLERIVNRHLQGEGNYTLELHRVLTAELIQRLFIEN
jgi:asparagine synthase (glutamine-hydrolysing)